MNRNTTKRPTSPFMEEALFQRIDVLDHGFVMPIDYMGTDDAIADSARTSYQSGTKKTRDNSGLINYLISHGHTSPFEMAEIKLHIKLPIFVARQWIRHRTANVNEESARYSILQKEFYIPEAAVMAAQATDNKQGRKGKALPSGQADALRFLIANESNRAYATYETLMNIDADGEPITPCVDGLARELARASLTLNYYTQWHWKVNAHNLMHFLRLRCDPHAQYEIRVYADVILSLLAGWLPETYKAFMEHQLHAARLSRSAIQYVEHVLSGGDKTPCPLSKRETAKLLSIFPSLNK